MVRAAPPPARLADGRRARARASSLGQAIGRLGCFAAGCCWGKATQVPWAVTFTDVYAARAVGTPMDTPVHPSQLYESFAAFLIFLFLLWLAPRKRFHGQVTLAYVALYSAVRFGLEFLRGDPDRGAWLGGSRLDLPDHRRRPAAGRRAPPAARPQDPGDRDRPRRRHPEEPGRWPGDEESAASAEIRARRRRSGTRPVGGPDHELVAGDEAAGLRLDAWLAQRLPSLSRARLQALIDEGHVLLDGAAPRASARLRAGQAVRVTVPAPVPAEPQPEDIHVAVVHEDGHLLVVDKPAGLVVHPGAGTARGTLVNALLRHVHDLSGVGGVLRPGIVHRLDRGTSGLLVVAKDDETHRALVRQFAGRTVEKEYLALVLGVPARARGRDRRPDRPRPRAPAEDVGPRPARARGPHAPGGSRSASTAPPSCASASTPAAPTRSACTSPRSATRWRATPSTAGRGRPRRAGPPPARPSLSLERPALHAARLAFTHPASGERLSFEAPLPPDLVAVLERLRAAARA